MSKTFLHTNEIIFSGYSNSGKTTLIESLTQRMSHYKVGYVKHDAHKFVMDYEGKDTQRVSQAGAKAVSINDSKRSAFLREGSLNYIDLKNQLVDLDLVFVEGFKSSKGMKFIVLDSDLDILKDPLEYDPNLVIGYIGESETAPKEIDSARYFCRENLDELVEEIESILIQRQVRPLKGLVLVGGRSSRMGEDKSDLIYHSGQTQAEYAVSQLRDFCDEVYLSVRSDQKSHFSKLNCQQISDKFIEMGPMGGILSAQQEDPNSAWLVLACDLPYLNDETLKKLVAERSPFKNATCFSSSSDGMPEPLCAIYEPKSYVRLMQFLAQGFRCPRKVLLNSEVKLIDLDVNSALDNVNHPNEKKIAKQYFKELR